MERRPTETNRVQTNKVSCTYTPVSEISVPVTYTDKILNSSYAISNYYAERSKTNTLATKSYSF